MARFEAASAVAMCLVDRVAAFLPNRLDCVGTALLQTSSRRMWPANWNVVPANSPEITFVTATVTSQGFSSWSMVLIEVTVPSNTRVLLGAAALTRPSPTTRVTTGTVAADEVKSKAHLFPVRLTPIINRHDPLSKRARQTSG